MNKNMKKLIILNLPYVIIGLFCSNIGEAWRLSTGADVSAKLASFFACMGAAWSNPLPSFHPFDLVIGIAIGAVFRWWSMCGARTPRSTVTMRNTVPPAGVTVDEDGNISFDMNGWTWTAGGETIEPETVEETITVGTVNVRSDTYLHLRTGPGMDQQIIGHLLRGAEVEVVGENGDWYEVEIPEMTGYVHKNYLDIAERTITTVLPGTGTEIGNEIDTDTLMMLFALMMNGLGSTNTPETPDTPDAEDSSNALTPDGNLTLVDDYAVNYEDGSGKQFITLTTKAGNVFYLVIDRDDKGEQNVHFMNLVDERDLLSLMEEDEAAEFAPTTEPEVQPPAETEDPNEGAEGEKPEPDTEVKKPASKINLAPVMILVLALVGGGGFFVYTKFFKGKGEETADKARS